MRLITAADLLIEAVRYARGAPAGCYFTMSAASFNAHFGATKDQRPALCSESESAGRPQCALVAFK
jgi:hypothetical protein